jgi:hypothetical protein
MCFIVSACHLATYDIYATASEYLPVKSTTPPVCQNQNVTSVTDYRLGLMQKFNQRSQNSTRLAWRIARDHWERQLSYLLNVANERPMLRTAAAVILAFCCATPFVLLFSSLVVYGVRSFIH